MKSKEIMEMAEAAAREDNENQNNAMHVNRSVGIDEGYSRKLFLLVYNETRRALNKERGF